MACSKCAKSFTFAVVRNAEISLVELGRQEARTRGLATVTEDELADWAAGMAETLDCFDVGDVVAYLDGGYWTIDATNIEFRGYYASHSLERLPHAEALSDPPRLSAILGDQRYWLDRERPDREP